MEQIYSWRVLETAAAAKLFFHGVHVYLCRKSPVNQSTHWNAKTLKGRRWKPLGSAQCEVKLYPPWFGWFTFLVDVYCGAITGHVWDFFFFGNPFLLFVLYGFTKDQKSKGKWKKRDSYWEALEPWWCYGMFAHWNIPDKLFEVCCFFLCLKDLH